MELKTAIAINEMDMSATIAELNEALEIVNLNVESTYKLANNLRKVIGNKWDQWESLEGVYRALGLDEIWTGIFVIQEDAIIKSSELADICIHLATAIEELEELMSKKS